MVSVPGSGDSRCPCDACEATDLELAGLAKLEAAKELIEQILAGQWLPTPSRLLALTSLVARASLDVDLAQAQRRRAEAA